METGQIELPRQKCAPHRRQWNPFFHLKMRQRVENVHDIFRILSFSSNSSSPDDLANERWGVSKWFNHKTARRSTHCIPLYLRGQRDAVCIWRCSSFFVRRLSVRRICNDVALTNGRLSEQRSRGDCCSPRQRSRWVVAETHGKFIILATRVMDLPCFNYRIL